MRLQILGCYAATPRSMTNPTSQVLEIRNQMFLIDCGEGTQVQLRKNKIKFSKISRIFISHLHGDHFFGLPGLVATFRLLGRDKELHIYGPKGIKEAITLFLKVGNSWTDYPLYFHELTSKESEVVYEDDTVKVSTIPLVHRIYTNGYLFEEKPESRKLNFEEATRLQIDKSQFNNIKAGKDITLGNGDVVPNVQLTFNPPKTKSYAFCSDTLYNPAMVPIINGVTVLYHESTFLESEAGFTERTKHSTAKEAASIAKEANVGKLILGHYSTRYKSIEPFKEEAQEIFPNTELGDDGKVFDF